MTTIVRKSYPMGRGILPGELCEDAAARCYDCRRPSNPLAVVDMVGRIVTCALLATSLLIFGMMSASAQTRSFYNERGSFAGQSFTRGNSTSFSDGRGRFSGSAIRHGNSTSFYDGRGRFMGSVIDTGPKRPSCAGPRGNC